MARFLLISCHPLAQATLISNDSKVLLRAQHVAILLSAENHRLSDNTDESNHTTPLFQENTLFWILL